MSIWDRVVVEWKYRKNKIQGYQDRLTCRIRGHRWGMYVCKRCGTSTPPEPRFSEPESH